MNQNSIRIKHSKPGSEYDLVMRRPSKKDIKAAVEKLRMTHEGHDDQRTDDSKPGKLADKKSSQRIRKKGV